MSENAHPVKAYRERQEPTLSQGKFGELVGVTRFTVIRWESGSPIDENKLAEVSKVTGVPAKELRPDLADKYEQIFGAV